MTRFLAFLMSLVALVTDATWASPPPLRRRPFRPIMGGAPTLAEKREELAAKQDQLGAIFKKYDDVASITPEDAAEIKRRNDELTTLGKEVDGLESLASISEKNRAEVDRLNRPVSGMVHPTGSGKQNGQGSVEVKSLGEILRASAEYQAFASGRIKTASFEITAAELRLMALEAKYGPEAKTLMTLTTINNPATRRPGIVESAQETATVRDLMLPGTTDNNALTYMEETTFTNAAATVAEGAAKPESALAFTERTDNVRKIATWIPATRELLADVKGIESYIRGRLMFMVTRTEEVQLLKGDGIAPNILGVQVRVGVQTQAKGADSVPAAVYKAMTKIRTIAFSEPTAVVFHPNDWQDVRLLTTADGIFIWGPPMDPGPERIWGLPIRVTTGETENTALVGAFRPMAQVFERESITVTVSTEHSTYFTENKVAILAEERLALAVYSPASFCTVTGI